MPRFRLLKIAEAKVGDEIKHHGMVSTIIQINKPRPGGNKYAVKLSTDPRHFEFYPRGAVFTQPPLD